MDSLLEKMPPAKDLFLVSPLPQHIAIVMDGNGRWATQRNLPRIAGHRAGVESVREVIRNCVSVGIEILTIFAFSSENWQRPTEEVNRLMTLFMQALEEELPKLNEQNVCFKVIGNRALLSSTLRKKIKESEQLTASNSKLTLIIAVSYGGRWDIAQTFKKMACDVRDGLLQVEQIDEFLVEKYRSLANFPAVDLFIRTAGEQRISNFLLWDLAYSELYFTNVLWPDFRKQHFIESLRWYAGRKRKFGRAP